MPATRKSDIYVAIESGSTEIDGEAFYFTKGQTLVRAGHKLLKACPDFFQPAVDHVTYDVEQATKAPGEKKA